MTLRRFFADEKSFSADGKITFSPEESRHMRDVLRLRVGEKIAVFDGLGKGFDAEISSLGTRQNLAEAVCKGLNITDFVPESPLDLTLAAALLKGDKFDLVVQKATELGVKKIVPLITKRADIRLNSLQDAEKKIERWRKIALEAAKQSRRAFIPVISKPLNFQELFSGKSASVVFLFAESGGKQLENFLPTNAESTSQITAVVGAEGGWEEAEIAAAKEFAEIVTLGGRILRAETAAVVVTALLQNAFGDLK